ncbi:MAG: DUF2330 domain-containing protein [Actinobacteria bacterium]|nr:DUF2330 domain-containing protein [Actinomycetota bacterium]
MEEYVRRGWFIAAMRLSPSRAEEEGEWQEYELSEGMIDPLRFTFEAPEPVYPLRISSLNPGMTEVLLYVTVVALAGSADLIPLGA